MAIEITMPKMGLSMVTGKVAKWLKKEGDSVVKGEAVLEVMTDKLTNTVDASANGILLRIVAPEEADLPVGALLGYIGSAGESLPAAGTAPAAAAVPAAAVPAAVAGAESVAIVQAAGRTNRVNASPLARKIAAEKGIDLATVMGTGPGGRIVQEDVEKAAAAPKAAAVPASSAAAASAELEYTVLPYAGIRRSIGDNMAKSWAAAAKVDFHGRADVSALLALRQAINEEAGDKVTVTDLLVKILAVALRKRPNINVSLDEKANQIKVYRDVNIGVAVALNNGLIVPVVHQADSKPVSQISREIKDLSLRAKENRLEPAEITGGTFTVTNLGGYKSVDWFTPIINLPEAGILGVGQTADTPVAMNGQVAIRPMMGLSLVCDHRVIDGAPAAEFFALLIKLIEKPYRALV